MDEARLPSPQSAAFLQGEGDAWFKRNRNRILGFKAKDDLACRVLELFRCKPKHVLEIGAANGFRLQALAERYGCKVQGTDASPEACEDGASRYGLKLHCQPAEQLPGEEPFDLVLIHFLLHWLDRAVLDPLMERVTEALEDGGLLLLGDFLPDEEADVPYHHLPEQGVKTFKRDYAALFIAGGRFRLIGMLSGDHNQMTPGSGVPGDKRIAIWLLEKTS
jgi:SAM-dependent methyltransferase